MYLLELRNVFLKDLGAIPLKRNHQKGWSPCLPVSVGGWNPNLDNCQLTDTAGLIALLLMNRLQIFTSLTLLRPHTRPFYIHSPCKMLEPPLHKSQWSPAHSPTVSSYWINSVFATLTNVPLCVSLTCLCTPSLHVLPILRPMSGPAANHWPLWISQYFSSHCFIRAQLLLS